MRLPGPVMAVFRSPARNLIAPSADWAGSEAPAANRMTLRLVRPGPAGTELLCGGGAALAIWVCWLGAAATGGGASSSPAAPKLAVGVCGGGGGAAATRLGGGDWRGVWRGGGGGVSRGAATAVRTDGVLAEGARAVRLPGKCNWTAPAFSPGCSRGRTTRIYCPPG